jgi:hypothetical protein
MYGLIRRDPISRTLPKWVVLAPLVSAQVTSFRCIALLAYDGTPIFGSPFAEAVLWMLILWVPVSLFVTVSGASQRISDLNMALPLPARQLWCAHVLARLLSGAAVLIVSILAVYAARFGMDNWIRGMDQIPITPEIDHVVPRVVAGFVLTVVLIQSLDSPLHKTRGGARYVLLSVAVLFGVWAGVAVLSLLPLASVLIPLLAAIAIGIRTLRALPPVFSVAPREPVEIESPRGEDSGWTAGVASGEGRGRRGSRFVLTTVMRAYWRNIAKPFFAYPFLFLMGLVLVKALVEDEVLRFLNVSLTVYMLLIFAALSIPGLYLLDSLPISRRRLFAALVLPSLVVISAGYLSGWIGMSAKDSQRDHVRLAFFCQKEDGYYNVRVPIGDWEIAWDGDLSDRGLPGEGQECAFRVRPLPGHPAVIYSPFTTPSGSSQDFVARQLSRAIAAVYGSNISPEEISTRYLKLDSDGRVAPKDEEGSLRDLFPGLKPAYRGPMFPILLLLVGFPWFIMLSLYFRTVRVGISNSVRKVVLWGCAALCLGLYVAPIPLVEAGLIRLWAIVGLVEILIRHVGTTPWGTALVWIGSALLLSGAYWLAQGQFERIEAPADPAKISPQLL